MRDTVAIIVFIIFVLIFEVLRQIIIRIPKFNRRVGEQIIKNFENQGYKYIKHMSDSFGSLKFKSPKTNITYELFDPVIIARTSSDQDYNFRVTNQKPREKKLKENEKRVFHHLDQFKITTTNANRIRFLFSSPHVETMNNLFTYITALEVKSKNGNSKVTVWQNPNYSRVSLRDDPYAAMINRLNLYNHSKPINLTIIKYLEVLIDIMNLADFTEQIEYDDYKCFTCGFKLSYYGDLCTNCGVIAPRCVICFEDPEPNESVILFNCCHSYAHHEHAEIWMGENNKCPSCQVNKPQLIQIREILSDSEVEDS